MQQLKILSLKFYSVLTHPSLNTEPLYTKHPTPYLPPISLQNWAIFAAWEALGKGLRMCFKHRNNVWGFNLLSVLNCLLTSLVYLMCEFWKSGFLANIYNRHYCSTSIIRASSCQTFTYLSYFHSSSDNVDLECTKWPRTLGKDRISRTSSIVGR